MAQEDTGDITLNVFASPATPEIKNEGKKDKRKRKQYSISQDIKQNASDLDELTVFTSKTDINVSKQDKGTGSGASFHKIRKLKHDEQQIDAQDDDYDFFEEQAKYKEVHSASGGKISSLFGNNPDIPVFARRLVKPILEPVFSSEHFKDLPIHAFMVSNLKQNLGLEKLTTVQQKAIPVLLSGRDALVRSQTGSGKTLAYAVPIVEALQKIRPKLTRSDGVQAVVVVPTRELALQTYEWFVKLVKPFTWLVPGCLVGGEKRKSEKARLRKGITILIGTPGRLVDHVHHTKSLQLQKVSWLVLDEADRLLDMGYEKEVGSFITALNMQQQETKQSEDNETENTNYLDDENNKRGIKHLTKNDEVEIKHQTVLLSATLTSAVEKLAGLTLHKPMFIDAVDSDLIQVPKDSEAVARGHGTSMTKLVIPESLTQFYIVTPPKLRLVTLSAFIISKCQMTEQRKMLIFMATQDMVDFHTELFSSVLGMPEKQGDDEDVEEEVEGLVDVEFFRLHGNMTQKERTEVFKTFRDAESGVLLCTDVAARGLDLPHVDWIVQYTAPPTATDYVHRVGRTARVGSAGCSLIFLSPSEIQFVRQLEDHLIRLQEETLEHNLQALRLSSDTSGKRRKRQSISVEAAATALQMRYENAVLERKNLHEVACKAYVSWVRFYASYPKEARETFSFKQLHLGHYAKSFALRDPPSSIGGIGRRNWQKQQQQNKGKIRPKFRPKEPKSLTNPGRTRLLITSEFASGLDQPPAKKKKKF